MWTLWLACAAPEPAPVSWPTPADPEAARRLDAARRYLDRLDTSRGDPPDEVTAALGAAATAVRTGDDPGARALLSVWLLDADVRRASDGAHDLRDVVRAAPDPVDLAGWHAAAATAAGEPLPTWTAQDLAHGAPDYGAALYWFGVAWRDDDGVRRLTADPGASPQARARRRGWR
jgi:hypothetical protein